MDFDLSTGDDVRSATIRSGLRGYHKEDVDDFREAAATLVDELRRRIDVASGHLAQLGLDEPLDLKQEFATVGKEISAILEAARTAATDIRQRATADGERWRAEAEEDAARMRSDAWEEASSQLESSVADAQQTRADADEDALFIRAQAEKEAIRLTSEAKRDADDVVRSARAEADAIIADARDAVEAAQERARALEVRREELMRELEEARRAIGLVEADIEEQHQRLVAPETQTVRVLGQEEDEPDAAENDGWLDEDATVRLVPGDPAGRAPLSDLEPVIDAEDIVAEVQSLQVAPDDPWSSPARDPEPAVDAAPVAPEPVRGAVTEPAAEPEPELAEPEPDAGEHAGDDLEAPTDETAEEPAAEPTDRARHRGGHERVAG